VILEVINIEVLAKTEYQDLYRVTDGVLLVVNKFIPIKYENAEHVYIYQGKMSKYNKGCQDYLKVLKENYHDEYRDIAVKKGTVLYHSRPVITTDNQADWTYEVKTTGSSLGGDFDTIERLLSSILYTIRTGNIR
jgi:hypothetical protein